jgi:hypothetical protein
LLERVGAPPRAVVLSGVRDPQVGALEGAWRARGLRTVSILHRAGFACLQMRGAE